MPSPRPTTMKLLLGSVATALVLLVAGCGDSSSSDVADDPGGQSPAPTTSPTDTPTLGGGLEAETIAIVTQTAVGGKVDLNAVPIGDDAARQEFATQFSRGSMDRAIAKVVAAATVPEGYTVMGAVVAIGCDAPPDVTVTQSPDGYVITPHEVASPLPECFAPVTSVAVVAVPA